MKRFVNLISLSLQLILVCGLVYASDEDEPKAVQTVAELLKSIKSICVPWQSFEVTANPVPFPTSAGRIILRVDVTPHVDCEEITVNVDSIDNLLYEGDASLRVKATPESTITLDLNIVIPSNDTSGLHLNIGCQEWNRTVPAYFVTLDDTVRYYFGRPRHGLSSAVQKAPKKSIDYGHLPSVPGTGGDPGRGYIIDSLGNVYPAESLGVVADSIDPRDTMPQSAGPDRSKIWVHDPDGNLIQVDTTWLFDSLQQAKIQARFEKMHELEQTPLTDAPYQAFSVDGVIYERRLGEYRFHKAPVVTNPFARSEERRDSAYISQGKVFDLVFDLRNSENYEYASRLIDNLTPSDSTGYYRATTDWKTVLQLREKGISFHRPGHWPRGPRDRSDQSDDSKKKK